MAMAENHKTARQVAAFLLNGVLTERKPLLELSLEAPPEAKAGGRRLAILTLRNHQQIDAVLSDLLTRKRPPERVMAILYLMAAEVLFSDTPDYAAVTEAVDLAKSNSKTAGFKGLINAIGRKLVTEGASLMEDVPAPELPVSFIGQMKRVFDAQAIQEIGEAQRRIPPIDLTLKDPAKADHYAAALGADRLPTGSLRIASGQQVSALEGFEAGNWWVQDAAAAMPAKCFDDVTGKTVLDLCAAPGGKTMQLAAMGAKVTALDISEERLARVHENLARVGLSAEAICADALAYRPDQKFDAILLDAPCSASGTLRRHPDLLVLKPNMDIGDLLALQRDLLRHAVTLLKPKGELVYATCSLFAAEGEAQAKWATDELDLDPIALDHAMLGLDADQVNEDGHIRLAPHQWADRGGLDGFFVAKFKAKG